MAKNRVLLTGVGAPGAYGIIRALKLSNSVDEIIGIDIKFNIPTQRFIDKFLVGPKSTDQDFINKVMEIALANRVNVIIPLVTSELDLFSRSKSLFLSKKINVAVMDYEYLEIVNNKFNLLTQLKTMNIDVPEFLKVKDLVDFEFGLSQLGYPQNILCFKPTLGNGSRGFRILDNKIDEMDLLFNQKPNSLYYSPQKFIEVVRNRDFPELLLMEYLPGDEYSVDVFFDGYNEIIVPRKRISMNGGITTDCIIEQNEDVISYCSAIVKGLNIKGVYCIQVKYSFKSKPLILEINPRLQGTVIASVSAGANFPHYLLNFLLRLPTEKPSINWGIRMMRFWEESYFDSLKNWIEFHN